MPDIDTSFYPKSPSNGFGSLTPGGVVGLVQGINDIQGRQGIAGAYRNNSNPDGTLDQPGLLRDLANSGQYAGEGVHQGLANARSAVELGNAKMQQLGNAFSSLTGIANPGTKDVHDLEARLSVGGVPPADIIKYRDFILSGKTSDGIKRNASIVGNQILGQGAGELTQGGFDPVTKQPVMVPRGQVNTQGATGGVITQPMEGASGAVGESQKQLVSDQKTSASTIANLRNLDIALPLAQKLSNKEFGPGSPEWARLRASAITAGLISANDNDPVTIRQKLSKYFLKYSTLARDSGRSDQALGAAVGSNPNLDLTQPANLSLIKNQFALDKMDAAIPHMFKQEHPAESDKATYNDYKSDYYNRFDHRVFSYDKLNATERRDLVNSLGGEKSPAYIKFNETYRLAKKAGLITPEKTKKEEAK